MHMHSSDLDLRGDVSEPDGRQAGVEALQKGLVAIALLQLGKAVQSCHEDARDGATVGGPQRQVVLGVNTVAQGQVAFPLLIQQLPPL